MNWEMIRSLYGAGCVYDERNCIVKLRRLTPQLKNWCRFENETDFAVAYEDGGSLIIVIRGTDGTNFRRWLKAWRANAKVNPDINGYAEGFNICGEFVLKSISERYHVSGYDRIVIRGHSRGGAGAQRAGLLIADKYGVPVEVDAWASPPIGNYKIRKEFNRLHVARLIDFTIIGNPGDPVVTLFRHIADPEKNGIDLVPVTWLPSDTGLQRIFKCIPFLVCEHRPGEYMDGLALRGRHPTESEKRTIKTLKKEFVN
jgi:hypothetical protein